ncbi:MAG: hypothetical protein V2A66_00650 [Pseudomonadota bacterium]
MKNKIYAASIAMIITMMIAGCRGQTNFDAQIPAYNTAAKSVDRADLVNAVWGDAQATQAVAVDSDALCLASSSFTFDQGNPFMIMKRTGATTVSSSTPVVIVSSINIAFMGTLKDGKADGRGKDCADGELHYIVTSSQDAPMDIEIAASATSQQPLDAAATDHPTAYPDKCRIAAHFDKEGADNCSPANTTPAKEYDLYVEQAAAEAQQQQQPAANCATTSTKSIKLVIDDFDCTSPVGLK